MVTWKHRHEAGGEESPCPWRAVLRAKPRCWGVLFQTEPGLAPQKCPCLCHEPGTAQVLVTGTVCLESWRMRRNFLCAQI